MFFVVGQNFVKVKIIMQLMINALEWYYNVNGILAYGTLLQWRQQNCICEMNINIMKINTKFRQIGLIMTIFFIAKTKFYWLHNRKWLESGRRKQAKLFGQHSGCWNINRNCDLGFAKEGSHYRPCSGTAR